MRLQLMLGPYPVHGSGAYLLRFGHRPHAPLRGIFRSGLQRGFHNRGLPFGANLLRAAAARLILEDTRQAFSLIALSATAGWSAAMSIVYGQWRDSPSLLPPRER